DYLLTLERIGAGPDRQVGFQRIIQCGLAPRSDCCGRDTTQDAVVKYRIEQSGRVARAPETVGYHHHGVVELYHLVDSAPSGDRRRIDGPEAAAEDRRYPDRCEEHAGFAR